MHARNLIPLITFLALLLAVTGCQTWQPGGNRYTAADGSYSLSVPSGWMFHPKAAAGGQWLATRDGPLLQRMQLEQYDLAKPLPHSKRNLPAGLTSLELAEAYVDELRANRDLQGLSVIENGPADVGGAPGFRLVVTYHPAYSTQLKLTETRYGAVHGGKLRFLVFVAPSRHYFERDLPTVEATAQSLRWGQ